MYKTMFRSGVIGLVASLLIVLPVSAHVTVKPADVTTASYTTFVASVPNEKDIPTVELRLLIPDGLSSVTPTVKPGWVITTETTESAEAGGHGGAQITSITWSGGSVPKGQRDDFTFSAKTPDNAGELQWKAYQTYADGTVVAWDRAEGDQPVQDDGSPDFSTAGPLSVTRVSDSDSSDNAAESVQETSEKTTAQRALYVSISAVVVAFISLVLATRPKK